MWISNEIISSKKKLKCDDLQLSFILFWFEIIEKSAIILLKKSKFKWTFLWPHLLIFSPHTKIYAKYFLLKKKTFNLDTKINKFICVRRCIRVCYKKTNKVIHNKKDIALYEHFIYVGYLCSCTCCLCKIVGKLAQLCLIRQKNRCNYCWKI